MRPFLRLTICAIVFCLILVASSPAQTGSDASVVRQVLDAWQRRRTAMKSVAYTIEGVQTHGKGALTTKEADAAPNLKTTFPPDDLPLDMKVVYTFDFKEHKARIETTDYILMMGMGVFVPGKRTAFFDGHDTTLVTRREDNTSDLYTPIPSQPDMHVYKGGTRHLFFRESYPILAAHGIIEPYSGTMDEAKMFDESIDASLFRFQQWSTLEGRKCAIVRTKPEAGELGVFEEFWVDLERESAILCWKLIRGGNVTSQLLITYQQVEGNWLPRSWQYDLYALRRGTTPKYMRTDRMKVIDIQIDPPLTRRDFIAPRRHGMVVSNTRGDSFVVGSDDETLVPYGASTQIWRWWHWVGLFLLLAIPIGGVAYWVRRTQPTGPLPTRS